MHQLYSNTWDTYTPEETFSISAADLTRGEVISDWVCGDGEKWMKRYYVPIKIASTFRTAADVVFIRGVEVNSGRPYARKCRISETFSIPF